MEKTDYLTTKQAAALLGVSGRSVLTWARADRFPGAFRTGGGTVRKGDWRLPRKSVEAFKAGKVQR